MFNCKIFTLCMMLMLVCVISDMTKEDREDWLDPNDMLHFDPASNKMVKKHLELKLPKEDSKDATDDPHQKEENSAQKETNKSTNKETPPSTQVSEKCDIDGSALPLFRQYVKTLLRHFDSQDASVSGEYDIQVVLSQHKLDLLRKFVDSEGAKHIHDAHEVLTDMVKGVQPSRLGRVEKATLWVEDAVGMSLDKMLQLALLGSLATVVILVELRLQMSWRKRLGKLIVFMFVVSIPWTWYELYKDEEIKRHSVVMKDVPAECQKDDSYFTAFAKYFTLHDDKCHAYYQHLLIDPWLKIPPTKAISVTFVRFFVAPLKDIGTAMSEFIRALLVDLPVTLYPVAIAIVTMFLFLFLFMWFGYSIRLPFFLSIEPTPMIPVGDRQLHKAIEDNSTKMMEKIQELQLKLEHSEAEIGDKLIHIETVQKTAIEYSIASPVPSTVVTPTLPITLGDSPERGNPTAESRYTNIGTVESKDKSTLPEKLDSVDGAGDDTEGKKRLSVDTVHAEGLLNGINS